MANTDQILKDFLKANPRLAKSKAKITINEELERYSSETDKYEVFDPPKIVLTVTHHFIFDRRLIPKKFRGYNVENVMIGNYPKEFPSENEELALDIWFAPERYISFVDNNLELLRTEFSNSSLTKEEALDALTGDFKKHIEWCKEVRVNINKMAK